MLSSTKVSFLGRPFLGVHSLPPEPPRANPQKWGLPFPLPRKTPKFGPNNCHTNNFLHCEFQLSMFSSSKVSFLGRPFWDHLIIAKYTLKWLICKPHLWCCMHQVDPNLISNQHNFKAKYLQNGEEN